MLAVSFFLFEQETAYELVARLDLGGVFVRDDGRDVIAVEAVRKVVPEARQPVPRVHKEVAVAARSEERRGGRGWRDGCGREAVKETVRKPVEPSRVDGVSVRDAGDDAAGGDE